MRPGRRGRRCRQHMPMVGAACGPQAHPPLQSAAPPPRPGTPPRPPAARCCWAACRRTAGRAGDESGVSDQSGTGHVLWQRTGPQNFSCHIVKHEGAASRVESVHCRANKQSRGRSLPGQAGDRGDATCLHTCVTSCSAWRNALAVASTAKKTVLLPAPGRPSRAGDEKRRALCGVDEGAGERSSPRLCSPWKLRTQALWAARTSQSFVAPHDQLQLAQHKAQLQTVARQPPALLLADARHQCGIDCGSDGLPGGFYKSLHGCRGDVEGGQQIKEGRMDNSIWVSTA